MKSKIGILTTSRNNFEFVERFWVPNSMMESYSVLNIDEDSTSEQKKLGREVCSRHGIEYLDRDKRGMQWNLFQACNWFKERGATFVLWYQHDCWPFKKIDFYSRLNRLVSSGSLDRFGVIGFNSLTTDVVNNYAKHRKLVCKGKQPMGVVARCIVEPRIKYYTGMAGKFNRIPAMPHPERFKIPFSVEVIENFAGLVNIDLYLKHVEPTSDYHVFMAWDDLCFQFLNHNVHNIVLPSFYVIHRPDLKAKCRIPVRSTGGGTTYHDKVGKSVGIWIKRWGWDRKKRETYCRVAKRYKGTLIDSFFNHNPMKDGPLRRFKL